MAIVFNATFSSMVVTFIGGENRSTRWKPPLSQVTDKLYHIMLYRVHIAWGGFELKTLFVIGTDCTGYKYNDYTITTTTVTYLCKDSHWTW